MSVQIFRELALENRVFLYVLRVFLALYLCSVIGSWAFDYVYIEAEFIYGILRGLFDPWEAISKSEQYKYGILGFTFYSIFFSCIFLYFDLRGFKRKSNYSKVIYLVFGLTLYAIYYFVCTEFYPNNISDDFLAQNKNIFPALRSIFFFFPIFFILVFRPIARNMDKIGT